MANIESINAMMLLIEYRIMVKGIAYTEDEMNEMRKDFQS